MNKVSHYTTATLTIALMFIFSAIYAYCVYYQFSFFQIALTATLFFLINIFLNYKKIKLERIEQSNIYSSVVLMIALLAIISLQDYWLLDYYRSFPGLEASTGKGWHHDTVFHTSIINSIVTFGYPSTGQHNVPILFYHTLSHYVDAILISIVNLDSFESYGYLFFFKKILFFSAIVYFVAEIYNGRSRVLFVVFVVFLTPLLAANWQAVGSHGLWFGTVLGLAIMPTVYKIVHDNPLISTLDYVFLFVSILLLSLSKISFGLVLAILVSSSLFFKEYLSIRFYIYNIFLLLLFYGFSVIFILSKGVSVGVSISSLADFIFLNKRQFLNQLSQFYLLLGFVFILNCFLISRNSVRLLLSGIMLVVTLGVVFELSPNMSESDIFYFLYSAYIVYILWVFQYVNTTFSFVIFFQSFDIINIRTYVVEKWARCFLIVVSVFIFSKLNSTSVGLFRLGQFTVEDIAGAYIMEPYRNIVGIDASFAELVDGTLRSKLSNLDLEYNDVRKFKNAFAQFISLNALSKNDSLLFISREILESNAPMLNGVYWTRGMFFYAISEVPLFHGVSELRGGYGYNLYGDAGTLISMKEFNSQNICSFKNKNIIVLENLQEFSFSVRRC